jgi:hypothetical protein
VLLDDRGSIVWLGLDGGEERGVLFSIPMRPARQDPFLQAAYSSPGREPVLYYETTPMHTATSLATPILDMPAQLGPVSTLYVQPFDVTATQYLFIPRTDADLTALTGRLRELFRATMTRCQGHLLQLTQDPVRMETYARQKRELLAEYYDFYARQRATIPGWAAAWEKREA